MIVDSLKCSILDFAVKGHLSKYDKNDQKIDEYLDTVKSYELIKRKDLDEEFQELYDIPKNWKWVQLGDITGIYGGKRIPAGRKLSDNNTGHKYIRVADMGENTIDLLTVKFITDDIYEKIKNYYISKEDLYITVAGTIGKVGYVPDELDGANLTENANKIVFTNINKKWLMYTLKSEMVQRQINDKMTKVGQPKLAIKRIVNLLIPIPPIEEQERIVNNIEKIFKILDDLKPIEQQLLSNNKEFPDKMKKSILLSAISGKLTRQNESESIEKILIDNELSKYIEKEGLFDIPKNWVWMKFGKLVDFNIGKTPPRAEKKYWSNDKKNHWISISDMVENGYVDDTREFVSDIAIKDIFKNNISKKGTLIMSFKLTVGRCSILNIDAVHNEGIVSIYPKIDNDIFKLYLFTILPFITKYGDTKNAIKGDTLNSKSLKELLIPIPPIEEQERIIKKINELDNIQTELIDIFNS